MTVVWKDPPKSAWAKRLAPLVEEPGRWAVVHTTKRARTAYSYASRLTAGELVGPNVKGRFEFKGATTEDGGGEIFARYLEPKNEPQLEPVA